MFGFVRRFVVLVYFFCAKIVPWGLMDWLLMVCCNRCCVSFVKKKRHLCLLFLTKNHVGDPKENYIFVFETWDKTGQL